MNHEAIPEYDSNNRTHEYIWKCVAHDMTDEDFEAIQLILMNREDDMQSIKNATVMPKSFGDSFEIDMYQPRPISQSQRDGMCRYTNWNAAMDIMLVISKYVDFYSKS